MERTPDSTKRTLHPVSAGRTPPLVSKETSGIPVVRVDLTPASVEADRRLVLETPYKVSLLSSQINQHLFSLNSRIFFEDTEQSYEFPRIRINTPAQSEPVSSSTTVRTVSFLSDDDEVLSDLTESQKFILEFINQLFELAQAENPPQILDMHFYEQFINKLAVNTNSETLLFCLGIIYKLGDEVVKNNILRNISKNTFLRQGQICSVFSPESVPDEPSLYGLSFFSDEIRSFLPTELQKAILQSFFEEQMRMNQASTPEQGFLNQTVRGLLNQIDLYQLLVKEIRLIRELFKDDPSNDLYQGYLKEFFKQYHDVDQDYFSLVLNLDREEINFVKSLILSEGGTRGNLKASLSDEITQHWSDIQQVHSARVASLVSASPSARVSPEQKIKEAYQEKIIKKLMVLKSYAKAEAHIDCSKMPSNFGNLALYYSWLVQNIRELNLPDYRFDPENLEHLEIMLLLLEQACHLPEVNRYFFSYFTEISKSKTSDPIPLINSEIRDNLAYLIVRYKTSLRISRDTSFEPIINIINTVKPKEIGIGTLRHFLVEGQRLKLLSSASKILYPEPKPVATPVRSIRTPKRSSSDPKAIFVNDIHQLFLKKDIDDGLREHILQNILQDLAYFTDKKIDLLLLVFQGLFSGLNKIATSDVTNKRDIIERLFAFTLNLLSPYGSEIQDEFAFTVGNIARDVPNRTYKLINLQEKYQKFQEGFSASKRIVNPFSPGTALLTPQRGRGESLSPSPSALGSKPSPSVKRSLGARPSSSVKRSPGMYDPTTSPGSVYDEKHKQGMAYHTILDQSRISPSTGFARSPLLIEDLRATVTPQKPKK